MYPNHPCSLLFLFLSLSLSHTHYAKTRYNTNKTQNKTISLLSRPTKLLSFPLLLSPLLSLSLASLMEQLDLPRASLGAYRHASPGDATAINASFKRPSGIPPAHPHYSSQIPPPSPASVPIHPCSLSQPTFFSLDSLPPLNPTSISTQPFTMCLPPASQGPLPTATSLSASLLHLHSNRKLPMRCSVPTIW